MGGRRLGRITLRDRDDGSEGSRDRDAKGFGGRDEGQGSHATERSDGSRPKQRVQRRTTQAERAEEKTRPSESCVPCCCHCGSWVATEAAVCQAFQRISVAGLGRTSAAASFAELAFAPWRVAYLQLGGMAQRHALGRQLLQRQKLGYFGWSPNSTMSPTRVSGLLSRTLSAGRRHALDACVSSRPENEQRTYRRQLSLDRCLGLRYKWQASHALRACMQVCRSFPRFSSPIPAATSARWQLFYILTSSPCQLASTNLT